MDDLLKSFLEGRNEDGEERSLPIHKKFFPVVSEIGDLMERAPLHPRVIELAKELMIFSTMDPDGVMESPFSRTMVIVGLAYMLGRRDEQQGKPL